MNGKGAEKQTLTSAGVMLHILLAMVGIQEQVRWRNGWGDGKS